MSRLGRLKALAWVALSLGLGVPAFAMAGGPSSHGASHGSAHVTSHGAVAPHGLYHHGRYRGGYVYWGVGPGWWGPCGWGWGWDWTWGAPTCVAYGWGLDPLYYPNALAPPPPPVGWIPPPNAPAPEPAMTSTELFMYPKTGQSAEQQGTDRYECHRWATDQTGFDPSQASAGTTERKREDYLRAMTACLEGRGYSVK